MSWIVSSIGDFFQRRRRAFAVTGGIVGGTYLVGKYALDKLHDTQQRMVSERRDKDNLRRRFAQNQDDCTFTTLALLPVLADQLFAALNVEEITSALQRKKNRSAPTTYQPGQQAEIAPGQQLTTRPPLTEANPPSATATPEANGGVEQEQSPSDLTDSTQIIKASTTATAASSLAAEEPSSGPGGTQDGLEQSSNQANGLDASSNNQVQSTSEVQPTPDDEHPSTSEQKTSATFKPDDPSAASPAEPPEPVVAQETEPVTDSSVTTTGTTAGDEETHQTEQPTQHDSTTTELPTTPPDATASSEHSIDKEGADCSQGASSSTSVPNHEQASESHAHDHTKPKSLPQPHALLGSFSSSSSSSSPNVNTSVRAEEAEDHKVKERQHTLTLWNELKLVSLSRAITGVYGIVLLTLQTHLMLNLIGRYSYLASVAALGQKVPTDGEGVQDDDLQAAFDTAHQRSSSRDPPEQNGEPTSSHTGTQGGIDPRTERLYLTFSWWLLHRGWPQLVLRVRTAVEHTFGQLSIMTPLSWHEFDRSIRSVRRQVE